MLIQNYHAHKSLSFNVYRFIKTKCEKLEYFSLIERPKKYMERHVTFLIFKNFATCREVFYLSVDDFQISKLNFLSLKNNFSWKHAFVFFTLFKTIRVIEKIK
jgi:hypothetical protein